MKALTCHAFKPYKEHAVEDVDAPAISPGHVRIEIHAAGINFPDLLMVEGKYQMKPPFPFIAGAECAGVITELGEGVKTRKIGERVLCVVPIGAFAEQVVAPEMTCFPLSQNMSFAEGAALTITYGTALHALDQRANLQAGEKLLVLGAAGGVGLAAIELGKAMGAEIIAAASSEEKCAAAKARGAKHGINYAQEDLKSRAKELSGGGVDVVFDPVGDKFAEPAMRALGWGGRFLVIGFAGGEIPKIPLNLTLLKSADIRGVFWGAWTMRDPKTHFANMAKLMEFFEQGKIKPQISNSYPLQDFSAAFDELAERRAIGKVVLTMR